MARPALTKNSQIAVIGGSLTGPTLALLLARKGFRATVYEAIPASAPQGGGVIGIDHVALDALETLGIHYDELVPFAGERIVSIKVRGRQVVARDDLAFSGANTTWTMMHRALLDRLPSEQFISSKRVKTVDETDGRAVLHFTDGTTTEADIVVFADGRKSTGRKLFDPQRTLQYQGYVAARGTVAMDSGLRVFESYEPGNTRLGVAPIIMADGAIGLDWTLFVPTPTDLYIEQYGAKPTVRTFCMSHHVSAAARDYVNAFAAEYLPVEQAALVAATDDRAAAPTLDIAAPDTMVWTVGETPVILIGDALAPVRAHTARGLNNGIDQAIGLTTTLAQHSQGHGDLLAALQAWEQRHLPLVAASIKHGPELARKLGIQV